MYRGIQVNTAPLPTGVFPLTQVLTAGRGLHDDGR